MVGEGLGKDMTADDRQQTAQTLFNTEPAPTVVSVGGIIVDRVIDRLEHDMYDIDMADEDWFPKRGESIAVDTVPDYVDDLPQQLYAGGRGPNQAVAAARAGADTALAGNGEDRHGRLNTFYDLEDAGVTIRAGTAPNGEAYVFRDSNGDNRIACVRPEENMLSANDLAALESEYGAFSDADYLLLNNDEPSDALEYVLDHADDTTVIFDPVPVDGTDTVLQHDAVDYVTPNNVEYRELKAELDDTDANVIVTTDRGAYIDTDYDQYLDEDIYVAAPNVDAVDTTAAGDTFNGYLAGCLSQGMELEDAANYAVHAASLSVTRDGAQPAIPTFDEVERFMDGG